VDLTNPYQSFYSPASLLYKLNYMKLFTLTLALMLFATAGFAQRNSRGGYGSHAAVRGYGGNGYARGGAYARGGGYGGAYVRGNGYVRGGVYARGDVYGRGGGYARAGYYGRGAYVGGSVGYYGGGGYYGAPAYGPAVYAAALPVPYYNNGYGRAYISRPFYGGRGYGGGRGFAGRGYGGGHRGR
jgi:hypothetical protein